MKKLFLLSYSLFLIPYFLFSQNIGIGTNTPSAKFEVARNETTLHGKNAAINLINTAFANTWSLRAGGPGTATPIGGFSIADNVAYRFVISGTGNIGIGTTTPQQMLSVQNGMNIDQAEANTGTLMNGLYFGSTSTEGIASKRTAGINQRGLDFYTNDQKRITITHTGLIGIN